MKRLAVIIPAVTCFLYWTSAAHACPFCKTETGRQVHAGIFNEEFWTNVIVILIPFPVLIAIIAFIHFGVPWPKRRKGIDLRLHSGRAPFVSKE